MKHIFLIFTLTVLYILTIIIHCVVLLGYINFSTVLFKSTSLKKWSGDFILFIIFCVFSCWCCHWWKMFMSPAGFWWHWCAVGSHRAMLPLWLSTTYKSQMFDVGCSTSNISSCQFYHMQADKNDELVIKKKKLAPTSPFAAQMPRLQKYIFPQVFLQYFFVQI